VVFAASRVITIDRSFDRAGRASGVTSAVVVRRRLRLSLARLLAFPARWCSVLISAALVVEAVFSVPGVGMLAQASVASGHRRSAEGAVLLAALLVPAALVVMALGRLAIDPRQRR
jgi:peptide/nickel transport system permease protein